MQVSEAFYPPGSLRREGFMIWGKGHAKAEEEVQSPLYAFVKFFIE